MDRTILIVDDEAAQLRLLEGVVARQGYRTRTAATGEEALAAIEAGDPAIDVVLLDLSMPVMNGIDVLKALRPKRPDLPVVVLTAHSGVRNVVDAMRAGASDFLVKPASAERIRSAIDNALESNALVGELEPVTERFVETLSFEDLIGASPAMLEAVDAAKKAAASNIPVFIEGESGVGKELFARAIQAASDRRSKAFVAVNCGAIPEHLVESILFGHERGSFTGADDKHIGKFEEANGGTLFLDEIGELPLDMQVKLLRAIQENEIDPIGARRPVKIDIRIISATNRNIVDQVATGAFREDLYYRLNVFPLRIPSLRERREDIPALVNHFIARTASSEEKGQKSIAKEALDLLINYDWPGNIRQLQNAVFRAFILCDADELGVSDFPQILFQMERQGGALPAREPAGTGRPGYAAPVSAPAPGLLPVFDPASEIKPLEEIEADVIRLALEKYNGRMSEIARRLGIGRSTLYRKVAEYGLVEKSDDPGETSASAAAGR